MLLRLWNSPPQCRVRIASRRNEKENNMEETNPTVTNVEVPPPTPIQGNDPSIKFYRDVSGALRHCHHVAIHHTTLPDEAQIMGSLQLGFTKPKQKGIVTDKLWRHVKFNSTFLGVPLRNL
eukprot:scaffold3667_cov180-Amphora_coffeaeformis.AAC.19